MLRNGFVTLASACRIYGRGIAKENDENQLRRVLVPAGDHTTGNMALPPVCAELPRRRRFARGARDRGLLRDRSTLGQSLRTDDRCPFAKAPPEALHHVASGRGLSEN